MGLLLPFPRDERQSKIAIFSHTRVCAAAEGVKFPCRMGNVQQRRLDSKTRMMWLPGRERSLTVSPSFRIQTIHEREYMTDRRTDERMDRQTSSTAKTTLTHSVRRAAKKNASAAVSRSFYGWQLLRLSSNTAQAGAA